MAVKVWDDGLYPRNYPPMLARIASSLSHRRASRERLAARARGPVADHPHRPAAEVSPIEGDTHRLHGEAMLHEPERSWTPIPCSGGCDKVLMFSGTFAEVDWTCRACVGTVTGPPALWLLKGGKRG